MPKDTLAVDILAARIRAMLPEGHAVERRMFGGMAFMVRGNLLCCAGRHMLLLRVGAEGQAAALELPGAKPFVNGTRPMTGFIHIDGCSIVEDEDLERAIDLGRRFVDAMPEKVKKERKSKGKGSGFPAMGDF